MVPTCLGKSSTESKEKGGEEKGRRKRPEKGNSLTHKGRQELGGFSAICWSLPRATPQPSQADKPSREQLSWCPSIPAFQGGTLVRMFSFLLINTHAIRGFSFILFAVETDSRQALHSLIFL
jgi:hypothetical protein